MAQIGHLALLALLGGLGGGDEVESTAKPPPKKDQSRFCEGEIEPPKVLVRSIPRYPKAAKARGVEGVVVMKILIDKNGKVRGTKLVEALEPSLDELTRKALRATIFEPCKCGDEPIDCVHTYRFQWELRDDASWRRGKLSFPWNIHRTIFGACD